MCSRQATSHCKIYTENQSVDLKIQLRLSSGFIRHRGERHEHPKRTSGRRRHRKTTRRRPRTPNPRARCRRAGIDMGHVEATRNRNGAGSTRGAALLQLRSRVSSRIGRLAPYHRIAPSSPDQQREQAPEVGEDVPVGRDAQRNQDQKDNKGRRCSSEPEQ